MGDATATVTVAESGAEVEEFLKECERSGDAAYAALKSILERLEDPITRSSARVFLAGLQHRFDGSKEVGEHCFQTYRFRIHDVRLADFQGYQKRKKLTMMEIPSIFIPEDWSFTFFEGLNRHPDSVFRDRTVAELGCGNGWISIALAEKWSPLKVYGLDINPRAVKVAWINLFLNALDEDGNLIYDEEGKTLLDRVEFHESDLLAYCRKKNIQLERIVGCIPQILNPNPEAMSKMITENSSEEFLYSLSNYCALQGFVEDQFGLGLIARAVEEGIEVIKPMGIMVFNIGGRPGQGVCNRLFERRGFRITRLWQTKVMQAADTDISALVEIEKNTRHRFEFFMGLGGDQPICARTAWAYAKSGGRISHALSVYSCQLRQPNQVKIIFDFLRSGFQEVSSSLDLSFDDESVADEKIPFLAYLASILKEISFLPYEPPAGSLHFRNLIAGFMKIYHHIPLRADNVTVLPSRAVTIECVLRLFSPRLAIVDEHLTKHLPKQWLTCLSIEGYEDKAAEDSVTAIEAPRQSDLMIDLIKKLKPQVVITGLEPFEARTSSAFENLLDTTKKVGSRLFLDISDHFELSSLPQSNGVLKYLSGKTLPSHAAIFGGLVKNKVYSDLEVAFLISENESIYKALARTVELLEGQTALFSQYYYGCLFHELLAFQLTDRHPTLERESSEKEPANMIEFASSALSALNDSELFVADQKDSSLVHMDLDQSFLPIPSAVKASIFESFARQNMAESETDVYSGIQNLVKTSYGFPFDSSSEFIFANSHHGLLNKLILCCIQENGTFFFPTGTNGNYVSAAKFMKAKTMTIQTHSEGGFKIVPATLESTLKTVSKPWLYISGPTVNPTGSLYSHDEIKEILSVCAKYGVRVVIDISFSGLEFQTDGWGKWDLYNIFSGLNSVSSSFSVSLLGGVSNKLLTGGLEFGFLISTDPSLIEEFSLYPSLSRPHDTLKYAIRKLLGLTSQKDPEFSKAINEWKDILKANCGSLAKTLVTCGWDVVDCYGGISMVAKPTSYLGKMLKLDSFTGKLEDSNIREAFLKATGLCINSGSWTGIPNYYRFTFALEASEFERALQCIRQFAKLVAES